MVRGVAVLFGSILLLVTGKAGAVGPVCDFFVSDKTNRVVFSQSNWSDLRIASKLRHEKKFRMLVDFSRGDLIQVGEDQVEVPDRSLTPTDVLAQVTEEFIPAVGQGQTAKYLWKTTLWSAGRDTHYVRRDSWQIEVDANRYSRVSEQFYRDQLAGEWLQRLPSCK